MSQFSNAAAVGDTDGVEVGDPRNKQPHGAVIRVHSNFVSQRQLSQVLAKACKSGAFRVEMRHNVYMIYLNKDDVEPVTSELSAGQRQRFTLKSSQWRRPSRRRDSEDTVSDLSDNEGLTRSPLPL
ncbi:hypothetical protein GQ53DRAFT_748857 [Thozetella sp. PMI_491]|nr:hypothetical protein GQ53DRAFT_748857 [Thozetella sp. PMI_491]